MKEKPQVGTAIHKPGKEILEEYSANTFITNHLTSGLGKKRMSAI